MERRLFCIGQWRYFTLKRWHLNRDMNQVKSKAMQQSRWNRFHIPWFCCQVWVLSERVEKIAVTRYLNFPCLSERRINAEDRDHVCSNCACAVFHYCFRCHMHSHVTAFHSMSNTHFLIDMVEATSPERLPKAFNHAPITHWALFFHKHRPTPVQWSNDCYVLSTFPQP
jgi:hypothetical protein